MWPLMLPSLPYRHAACIQNTNNLIALQTAASAQEQCRPTVAGQPAQQRAPHSAQIMSVETPCTGGGVLWQCCYNRLGNKALQARASQPQPACSGYQDEPEPATQPKLDRHETTHVTDQHCQACLPLPTTSWCGSSTADSQGTPPGTTLETIWQSGAHTSHMHIMGKNPTF